MFKFSKVVLPLLSVFVGSVMVSSPRVAEAVQPTQVAVAASPVYLKLEFSTACTDKGAMFKIVNHGEKWPSTAFLRLYRADSKSEIGERRMRLAADQKVTFVIKDKVSDGHPVALWVEPGWYSRDFKFDARLDCNQ